MVIVGFTHYHPYSDGTAVEFSPGDWNIAKNQKAAAHLITYDKQTRDDYYYLTAEKREWVIGE